MSLSVCCSTVDDGPRVRAALESAARGRRRNHHRRRFSSRPKATWALRSLADRVIRFEFAPPIERCWPWLFAQCSSDWILYVDGSDVCTPSLVRRLPGLIRRKDVLQYWLLSRWLYPDKRHWLDQFPWNHFVNRLVRNDPAHLHVLGLSHTLVDEKTWPRRFLNHGFYRSRCVISPHAERREHIRYYSMIPDELKRSGSDAWLYTTYLPEEVPSVSPVAVPSEDLASIEAVVEASGPELPTTAGRTIPLATREEIDRYWPSRTLERSAYKARLELLDRDRVVDIESPRPWRVKVANKGSELWPGGERNPLIRVGYRWRASKGSPLRTEEPRTPFPAAVAPGSEAVVPVIVVPPPKPGKYTLEFDVVHEFVRWFDCTTSVEMSVESNRS